MNAQVYSIVGIDTGIDGYESTWSRPIEVALRVDGENGVFALNDVNGNNYYLTRVKMKIGEVGTSNWIREITFQNSNQMYSINSAATHWEPDLSEFEIN